MSSIWGNTTWATNSSTTTDVVDWGTLLKKFAVIKRDMLRSDAILSELQCPICRRKVTVVEAGYVVCQHMRGAIELATVHVDAIGPVDEISGVRIFVDDVPRGW